jgi:threonylcarbamoyladenosine tRNA methylthiotransferase MtaB
MNPAPGRYVVRTLGCKANFADSQLIEAALQDRGWRASGAGEPADLCILNSCTVTDEADRESRRQAARLSRQNPDAAVVLTGCGAEIEPERLAGAPGVSYVVGNSDKSRLADLILKAWESARSQGRQLRKESGGEILGQVRNYTQMLSRHPMDREWPLGELRAPELSSRSRTRVFLKVQEGCNSFCTFCVIPYGRGPARSHDPQEVVREVARLSAAGVREIVLTGTNLGDYGVDLDETQATRHPRGFAFEMLVRRVLSETSIERLRLGSLDPTEITPGLIDLVRESNSRLCPHFHVSLQSVDTRILRGMKRRYTAIEVRQTLERIATELPHAFVGMDLITGFPGETDAIHDASARTLEELPWTRLHVFPYSERTGTPATRMPGSIAGPLRLERTRELNRLGLSRHERWVRQQLAASGGSLPKVLIEHPARWGGDGLQYLSGYTPNYIRVLAEGDSQTAWNRTTDLVAREVSIDPSGLEVAVLAHPV